MPRIDSREVGTRIHSRAGNGLSQRRANRGRQMTVAVEIVEWSPWCLGPVKSTRVSKHLKPQWDIGRYSKISFFRNSRVTRRQGSALQIEASKRAFTAHGAQRKHSPKNAVIFMQPLAWLPCVFPIPVEIAKKMTNSDVQFEYLLGRLGMIVLLWIAQAIIRCV
jgi:hypothetical protein